MTKVQSFTSGSSKNLEGQPEALTLEKKVLY
jgi:hypothetical protein